MNFPRINSDKSKYFSFSGAWGVPMLYRNPIDIGSKIYKFDEDKKQLDVSSSEFRIK